MKNMFPGVVSRRSPDFQMWASAHPFWVADMAALPETVMQQVSSDLVGGRVEQAARRLNQMALCLAGATYLLGVVTTNCLNLPPLERGKLFRVINGRIGKPGLHPDAPATALSLLPQPPPPPDRPAGAAPQVRGGDVSIHARRRTIQANIRLPLGPTERKRSSPDPCA